LRRPREKPEKQVTTVEAALRNGEGQRVLQKLDEIDERVGKRKSSNQQRKCPAAAICRALGINIQPLLTSNGGFHAS
jgi:hypothetical protein